MLHGMPQHLPKDLGSRKSISLKKAKRLLNWSNFAFAGAKIFLNKVGFCCICKSRILLTAGKFFLNKVEICIFWPFLSAMSFLSSLFCFKYISWRSIHKVHTKKVSKLSPNHTFRFFASPEKFYFLRISTLLRKRQTWRHPWSVICCYQTCTRKCTFRSASIQDRGRVISTL